jgi:hypothetical protein
MQLSGEEWVGSTEANPIGLHGGESHIEEMQRREGEHFYIPSLLHFSSLLCVALLEGEFGRHSPCVMYI